MTDFMHGFVIGMIASYAISTACVILCFWRPMKTKSSFLFPERLNGLDENSKTDVALEHGTRSKRFEVINSKDHTIIIGGVAVFPKEKYTRYFNGKESTIIVERPNGEIRYTTTRFNEDERDRIDAEEFANEINGYFEAARRMS